MNLSDLKRAAEHADTVQGNPRTRLVQVHLRIRGARRRRTAAVAGALAIALGLGGAAVNEARQAAPVRSPAGSSSVSPVVDPTTSWCTASATAPAAGRVGFIGLPPEGAAPSSTTGAPLVLEWFGGDADGWGKSDVWVFADGRLIVEREAKLPQGANERQTGYLERCLSPAGVESLRRHVIEEGLILTDEPPYPAWLRVRAKDGRPLIDFDPLAIDEQRLLEPETWLHESDWIDKRYRPYVPTTYSFCSSVPPPLVGSLRQAVASLLRSRTLSIGLFPAETCATLKTDEARHVVEMLENEWFRSDYDGPPAALDVGLSTRETSNVTGNNRFGMLYLSIEPVLPDGQLTCNCG